jgi:hypothetical protein
MTKKQGSAIEWRNVRVKLGQLQPWGHNPRTSTKKQAQRILESFKTFGQVQTIAIGPSFEVYDGHQRLSALLTIYGKDYEIDARQSNRALTDDERRRLVIALHAGAQGAWDWDLLSGWDESLLTDAGMDAELLEQINRDAAALREMLEAANAGASDAADPESDKADELQKKWKTERGQVWQVGNHRVMCGDSTDKQDVINLIGGKVDICVTDPPYEMGVEMVRGALSQFGERAVLLVTGKQAYTLCGGEWEHHMDLMWKHRQPRSFPTKNQPVMYHNPVVMMTQRGVKLGWQRPRNDFGSVIEIAGTEFEKIEFGQAKSVDLFVAMMEGFKHEVWGDPFLGAGTSLLAAERLGRRLLGMELSATTLAVALERFNKSGLEPQLIKAI